MLIGGGAFYLGRISVENRPSELKSNQPPNDNREIQQLKTELNSVKNELSQSNSNQKSELESKLTEIENKVNEFASQDKETVKKLEQELKEIKKKLKEDKPDNNDDEKKKKEIKVRFVVECPNEKGEISYCFNNFLESGEREAKYFYISKNHPRIKQLLSENKLRIEKEFIIRYKKADLVKEFIYRFNENNKELEIKEV